MTEAAGRLGRIAALAAMGLLLAAVAAAAQSPTKPPPTTAQPAHDTRQRILKPGEAPDAGDFTIAPGFEVHLVGGEMTFPTAMAFGPAGEVYVVEGGYSYGSTSALPRVLLVLDNGTTREVARLPDGPVTGLAQLDGVLYAIGGRDPAALWRIDPATGAVTTLVSGFPVWGHHFTSQLAVGPDRRLYFAVGMPSNSGVIGLDDFNEFQYLSEFPDAHDIPCLQLKLVGQNFETSNPFTAAPDDTTWTGAFKPFRTNSTPGEVVPATPPPGCNGAVFSVAPDGSGLRVVANGFRNPWGIRFAPDGRLFLVDQGMDNGGSRPVAEDTEPMWEIHDGGWYGFPDFPSGFPVTLPGFQGEGKPAPQPLLMDPPPLADKPFFLFVPSCGCMQFDFSHGGTFGKDQMFLAEYGSQFHNDRPGGFRIEQLDLATKTVSDFYVNLKPGPDGTAPERPISVAISPDGSRMYLLDFGDLSTDTLVFFSSALTGGLWRIDPVGGANVGEAGAPAGGVHHGMPLAPMGALAAVAAAALAARRRRA